MAGIATIENVGLSRARLKCTAEVDNLAGCRVLVLEDEYFLASDLEQELTARGAIVVGPFAEISKTKDQVANGGFDVAVIDIDLRGEPSFSIADELIRRRIPFIFVTGYSPEVLPVRFQRARRCEKPVYMSEVLEEVGQLCGRNGD
jgi:DNA-binding NtrC family response regulator